MMRSQLASLVKQVIGRARLTAFAPPVTLPDTATSTPPPPAAPKPSTGDEPVEALERLKDLWEQNSVREEEQRETRKAILDRL